jgi:hypothetical protein
VYMYVGKYQILFECMHNERKVKFTTHGLEHVLFIFSLRLAMKLPRETAMMHKAFVCSS